MRNKMPNAPVLLRHFAERASTLPSAGKGLAEEGVAAEGLAGCGRRERIWELSSNFHCSIVGTCLTTADLRQLFTKLKNPSAKTASDHEIHGLAVTGAGSRDLPGKLLNKMLDKRHEGAVRRFSKAKTVEDVRALWRACLDKGEVPGAYWAVLTHPSSDKALIREAFGDVHMLSHLVGMSNRADIARLRELERDLGARDEKIARQEARLRQMGDARAALLREAEQLRIDLRRALEQAATPAPEPEALGLLRQRLADEQNRSAVLSARLAEREQALAAADQQVAQWERHAGELARELGALEASLMPPASTGALPQARIDGLSLLYVGGRPKQVEQLRTLAERLGGTLLSHDGGVEEATALLPGLVSQADIAFFPVDCVSHLASSQVKRLCREAGKAFVPLRTSGLASFAAALADLPQRLPQAAE